MTNPNLATLGAASAAMYATIPPAASSTCSSLRAF